MVAEKLAEWGSANATAPFVEAARRAGVLLASQDLLMLANRFGVDPSLSATRGAAWPRFLRWAVETDSGASAKEKRLARALRSVARLATSSRLWGPQAFERYDRDREQRVDARDFRRALVEDLRCDLDAQELEALIEGLADPRGLVPYLDFVRRVDALGDDDRPMAAGASSDAVDILRDALKVKVREGVDFRAAFEREDGAYSGVLDRPAFTRVLQELDCSLAPKDLDALESKFRAASRGGVHYVEMLNVVLPPRPEKGENWRVEEKLRAMIKRRFEWWQPGALRRAFKHFDTARKGRFAEGDLADGLRALKFKLSAEQEHDLFAALDLDKDGPARRPWNASARAEATPAGRTF